MHNSGHPSAAGQAHDRESLPARDCCSTYCATQPMGQPVDAVGVLPEHKIAVRQMW